MALDIITALASSLLQLPEQLAPIASAYLLALMVESPKHSQTFAAKLTGLDQSQFSRFLADQQDLALASLGLLARTVAKSIPRTPVVKGAPWTIAIIIDATLHPRSSRHVQNVQRLNHGKGFIVGHQWTNIVLLIGGRMIPLPPIAYFTKSECKRRGIAYRSEHDCVDDYLRKLNLASYVGSYGLKDVLVLADAGYDNKLLQNTILDLGWDFIVALKSTRGVMTTAEINSGCRKWRSAKAIFLAVKKQAPWTSVRLQTNGGKRRRTFRTRKLNGSLKGVHREIAVVCSEKSYGKRGRRYFACSEPRLRCSSIMQAYSKRWTVELFHRAAKNQLGMLDAGVHWFDSLKSHIHWTYCAYILLDELKIGDATTMLGKQRLLTDLAAKAPWERKLREIQAAKTQFGGMPRLERLLAAALDEAQAA